MQTSQESNESEIVCRASGRQRKIAGLVFVVIAGFFGSLYPAARGKIDIGLWLGPCGLKQRYGLPCPTCGMTTSALTFVRGQFFEAFRVQPAAGLMCSMLVVTAFFLGMIAIIGGGWMVTLTRALAER
jgi:hypothetical protein